MSPKFLPYKNTEKNPWAAPLAKRSRPVSWSISSHCDRFTSVYSVCIVCNVDFHINFMLVLWRKQSIGRAGRRSDRWTWRGKSRVYFNYQTATKRTQCVCVCCAVSAAKQTWFHDDWTSASANHSWKRQSRKMRPTGSAHIFNLQSDRAPTYNPPHGALAPARAMQMQID
jgi:hypothetical protein